jgi:hypothetical protein
MQEKEKEVLMKEEEENYHKFRQLLDYEDVRCRAPLKCCGSNQSTICFPFHRLRVICSSIRSFVADIAPCCRPNSAGSRYFGGQTKQCVSSTRLANGLQIESNSVVILHIFRLISGHTYSGYFCSLPSPLTTLPS